MDRIPQWEQRFGEKSGSGDLKSARRTFRKAALLPALLVGLAACSTDAPETTTVKAFTNANIYDGTGAAPVQNGVILVQDGKILQIGAGIEVPEGAEVVDLAGKWVIPGLINAHAHVDSTTLEGPSPANQLAQYAHYGVTTVLSLGETRMDALNARDTSWTAQPPSARVLASGVIRTPMTAEAARAIVDTLASQNVNYVKIRVDDFLDTQPIMPPEAYTAVIEAAHAHNLPVAVHFVDLDVAKGVLRAGADLLAHSVRDMPVDSEFVALMRERNTCLIPTLTRELSTFYLAERPAMFDDPFFREKAAPPNLDTYITPAIQTAQTSPAAEYYKSHLPVAEANLRQLYADSIQIAFGTDTGIGFPGRFQGYLEHEELRMLVAAGLTPEQALRSATGTTAKCIGREGVVGTLVPGAWADMVVLNANPLEDIMNTRNMDSVWLAGNKFR